MDVNTQLLNTVVLLCVVWCLAQWLSDFTTSLVNRLREKRGERSRKRKEADRVKRISDGVPRPDDEPFEPICGRNEDMRGRRFKYTKPGCHPEFYALADRLVPGRFNGTYCRGPYLICSGTVPKDVDSLTILDVDGLDEYEYQYDLPHCRPHRDYWWVFQSRADADDFSESCKSGNPYRADLEPYWAASCG